MRIDVATRSMPDFKDPEFLGVLSLLRDKQIDLATAYLTTLTALTLGMKCEFVRSSGGDPLIRIPVDKTFPLPVLYKVTSGEVTDHFHGSISVTKLNSNMARLTKNKVVTRRVLASNGIQTPFGGLVWSDNMRALDDIAKAGVQRVLVKPNKGSLGRGIQANITIDDARAHIAAHPNQEFVVEQFIVGREYRVFTVGGKYGGCFARLRDHVIGNGQNTLRELITAKHRAQLTNPFTRAKAAKTKDKTEFLRDAGVDLNTVPEKGRFVWLNDDQIPKGDDGVYEPTGVSAEVKKLAHDLARAIGADTTAIDLIDRGADGTYVLEVNSKPNILGACFPMNADWNLRFPEAVLRNSFPKHKDKVRRIKRYDYLRLIKDYHTQTDVTAFNAKDYVEYE